MAWIVVRSCAVSIALALAGTFVRAQDRRPPRVNRVLAAQRNTRIVSLLEQLADQALTSENPAFAVRAQSQAARLLWPQDPERARAIYTRAFHSLVGSNSSKPRDGATGDSVKPSTPQLASQMEKLQLRTELLNQITARDPELAEELARSLADNDSAKSACGDGGTNECGSNNSGSQNRAALGTQGTRFRDDSERCELLMSAALQVVDRDPQQAMAFAQMSVALGVSSNLSRLLTIMRAVDPERADLLFSNAMTRLERAPHVDLSEIHTLGSYVVSAVNSGSRQPPNRPLVLRFLNFAFDQLASREQTPRAPTKDDPPALYFIGRQLTDLFGRFLPYRLDQLHRYVDDQGEAGPYEEAVDPTSLKVSGPGDIARAAIETSDQAERDSLYARASLAWLARGDVKEAQNCALKVTDSPTRDRVLVQVVRRYSSEKHLEDAIALTRRISDETPRVELLVMLSSAARAGMDNTRAAELLNEAGACSLKAKPSFERARSLVMIASSFSAFDTTRSFEVFQSAIKAIDDIIKQQVDTKEDSHGSAARTRVAQSVALDALYAASFENTLAALAKADFESALALARQLPGEEASVIAQLAVCSGGLVESQTREQTLSSDEADSGLDP